MQCALMVGKSEPCPKCGSTELRVLKWRDESGLFSRLKARRRCLRCKHVFEPASSIWVALAIGLWGVLMVVVGACTIFSGWGNGQPFAVGARLVLSILAILGGVSLIVAAVRAPSKASRAAESS